MAARIAKCLRTRRSGRKSTEQTRWSALRPLAEVRGQTRELLEAVPGVRLVGRAPKLGGRGAGRRDGAGRRSADVAKAILRRQPGHGAREDDARRDAALHHQVAEPAADIVGIDPCIRHDLVLLQPAVVHRTAYGAIMRA
jgi:hypothetical protein